jgi:hypothetical protein
MVGRTDDASSLRGGVRAPSEPRLADASGLFPFKLGSSSAPGSTSWSESISVAAAETPLDFLPDLVGLGLGLSAAFRGSWVGSGSFLGDISIRYSGW